MSERDITIKIKAGFLKHPKVAGLSGEAFGVWFKAMIWVQTKESDGRLSAEAAQLLELSPRGIATLVKVGLWECAEDFEGWVFHDYLDVNPSGSKVQEKLEANRRRVAKHRAAKKSPADKRCNALPEESKPSQAPPAVARVSAPTTPPLEPPPYAQKLIERAELATVTSLVPTREAERAGYQWFFELTTRQLDLQEWRREFARIGAKPERERALVAEHWRASNYIHKRPTKYGPSHALKYWDDFVTGPREMEFELSKPLAKTFQPGAPSSRQDIERAHDQNPDWVTGP